MKTITISYARTHLLRVVREVANGEIFIVTKDGKPLVTFKAVPDTTESVNLKRNTSRP